MILATHLVFEQVSPAAKRPGVHSSGIATARMGLPVPGGRLSFNLQMSSSSLRVTPPPGRGGFSGIRWLFRGGHRPSAPNDPPGWMQNRDQRGWFESCVVSCIVEANAYVNHRSNVGRYRTRPGNDATLAAGQRNEHAISHVPGFLASWCSHSRRLGELTTDDGLGSLRHAIDR